jgi:protein SCO1/2
VKITTIIFIVFFSFGCKQTNDTLPILGEPFTVGDMTTYPTVAHFELISQDSTFISETSYRGKIYVADFIFLNCPTICPMMTTEMKKVYEHYLGQNEVQFISFSIDPENDTPAKLKEYAASMDIRSSQWQFLTGKREKIYDLATNSFFTIAHPESTAPGGYIHGGGLLLVDPIGQIRGVYDGTNPQETQRLIADVSKLLKAEKNKRSNS